MVKWGCKEDGVRKWTGFFVIGMETRENSCENGNEPDVSIKERRVFDYLGDFQFLKEDSTVFS
jgi:hypothetical protein